ncbi:hypothetical protein LGL08_19055 [Clostridium estertheticum]|uniref:hypothetical protein n=1 Tax=Clostridium estertheticum TaxID=238834 RepID=UPI001CF17157|nr:hypothetical protein [Clostridium estertheticum]MCB2308642.1 hypothetical protein [Clostridium estertheticum]MCB2344591.1 hypothetical protein [Clostridium estertheticum]MCB2351627.1 hypothetical protein [Clostridium estertheticum]WAG45593.1 hypothetical protein LL127_19050 [Clostridium estertheticum]
MTDYSKFDLVTFAILLEKAKGDRSINQYANTINISAAHISRLLRKLVKSPPSPDTISKFASGACNGVTYNDLMLAAGHIDDKTEGISTEKKQTQTVEKEKNFFKVILSDLYTRDFEWSLNKTINGPANLMLEITNWEYSNWYIQIKPYVTSQTIYNIYGQIACIDLTPVTKISVAVGSKNEFDLFFSNPPKSLRANLYIMLIDLDSGKIMKEEKLCQY